MSPKEKAEKLISKMKQSLYSDGMFDAKRCALVAVDEILTINSVDKDVDLSDYWEEVKQEIEKL